MKTTLQISINIEKETEDYHDLVLIVMQNMVNKLCGGYYEPKSDRDAELANAINSFLKPYNKNQYN
jgi:hypothetical protein